MGCEEVWREGKSVVKVDRGGLGDGVGAKGDGSML